MAISSRPPYAAPSWGRWVKGKDGWMLHEKNPGAKKKKRKDDLKIADANNIVPIKTEESINKRLLKMTGDKKRYGGGPGRVVKKGNA